eukprot:375665_1
MQLRKTHVGALTNNEVLIILNKQLKWHQTSQKKYKKALPKTHKLYPCQWIANEVTSYLLETPASNQTRSDIRNLLNEIEKIDIHNNISLKAKKMRMTVTWRGTMIEICECKDNWMMYNVF